MSFDINPFNKTDPDRSAIWDMLVVRDIDAFLAQDWGAVADDFDAAAFCGIHAGKSDNPDSWRIAYPDLATYREDWLAQAKAAATTDYDEPVRAAIFRASTLRDIEISGNHAVARKKFDGIIRRKNQDFEILNWQTLYYLSRSSGAWKISGFTGYLPNPMGSARTASTRTASAISTATGTGAMAKITVPAGASQHATAGPYSPVLQVQSNRIVVISGQVAVDMDGTVRGDSIEEQTRLTIENCRRQLEQAGCGLSDVFKVTVYMTDLSLWPRFNAVYREIIPRPHPVRTAVGVNLLPGFIVEIEMWAAL